MNEDQLLNQYLIIQIQIILVIFSFFSDIILINLGDTKKSSYIF